MLATQMSEKIASGELDRFSIVRILRYLCNNVHDRRLGQDLNQSRSLNYIDVLIYSVALISILFCNSERFDF